MEVNEDTQYLQIITSSQNIYNILEVSWNFHFWSSRWKLINLLLWRQVGTLKSLEGCCSNLDSKFTPAFRRLEADYFSGPGSNLTIGSIAIDAFWDSSRFRYPQGKLLLRKLAPVVGLVFKITTGSDFEVRLSELAFNILCPVLQIRLSKGSKAGSPWDDWLVPSLVGILHVQRSTENFSSPSFSLYNGHLRSQV